MRITRHKQSRRLHQAAWPDMFSNLQIAYSELTQAQFELRRRASEIEDARDLFQRVIESMSEALFLMNRVGTVIRINPAARQLLELDEEQLVGRPFHEVVGSSAIPSTPWQLIEQGGAETQKQLEVELSSSSGRLIPISASCGLVRDKAGKIVGMLVVARDVTERKQAEEALARQAQELARSNADLEQFAYIASHDLQEPLRMVAGFTQLLERRYGDQLDADGQEFLGYIVDGAARMHQLINDLLLYSRVSTRGHYSEAVDCAQVLAAARANLQLAIEESGATISAGDLPVVRGNRTQLVQLFQNLIGNALKFRSERPMVVEVSAEPRDDQWLLRVRDTGIGIDPQHTERIFMIFQRLHTVAEYAGTGIGLAICKKIIERHGGSIWVESEVGVGSTFCFLLPAYGSEL